MSLTPEEEVAINGAIADALYGWDHKESGMWADPTGDEYKMPPNYADNSGLIIGLEYKLGKRGFAIQMNRSTDGGVVYTLSKDGVNYTGTADRQSQAICLAIKAVIDANVLK